MAEANVDVVAGMRDVTWVVTLTRTRELYARVWVAKLLVALACWVMNSNLRIVEE